MSDILKTNTLVISKKGKLLASFMHDGVQEIKELLTRELGDYIDDQLNERLLNILSTKENVNMATLGFSNEINASSFVGMIVPIDIAGERLGTLFFYRKKDGQDNV